MPLFKFKNPLTITDSTGVTSTGTDNLTGTTRSTPVISIGQNVATGSSVTFAQITGSNTMIVGTDSQNIVLGYQFISGSTILLDGPSFEVTENHIHNGDLTINGKVSYPTASISGTTYTTTIHQSGSTTFGDTIDDTHIVTGSLNITGSLVLNDTFAISGISNNSDFSAARTDYLVTERAAYIGLLGDTANNNVYLRKQFAHTGSLSNATASFSATSASVSTLTATTKNDFQFFLNGMIMEPDALTIMQKGTTFETHINQNSLGYLLSSDDEVVAWGKFNS